MKILHFDCRNGISGDMMLGALVRLGGCESEVAAAMKASDFMRNECGHQSRSFSDVKQIIAESIFSEKAKAYAEAIYQVIAEAEAEVHEESLDTVHFHEVGRDEAIRNALGIGMALDVIDPDRITTSPINDGKGTITCSHGEIPVPVPAVRAMMRKSTFTFHQIDVDTEMVTPSGLAALIGIGAQPEEADITQNKIFKETEVYGARNTGRGGLKAYIYVTGGNNET